MTLLQGLLNPYTTIANRGTVSAGTTLVSDISPDGILHTTKLTLNTTLGAIAGGASLGLGKQIFTFPAGEIIVNGSYISVAITQSQGHINSNTPVVGLGTTVASGAVSVLSGTQAFQNIMAGQTAADCNGTATVKTVGTQLVIAAGGAHTLFFNVAAAWSASGDAAAALTGTVMLTWSFVI